MLKKDAESMNHKAFMLVVVMALSTAMSIIALGLWRRSSYTYDILVARQAYYKRLYKADSALRCMIRIVHANYSAFLKPRVRAKMPITIRFDEVDITVDYNKDAFFIQASDEHKVLAVQCTCRRICDTYVHIDDYTISSFV